MELSTRRQRPPGGKATLLRVDGCPAARWCAIFFGASSKLAKSGSTYHDIDITKAKNPANSRPTRAWLISTNAHDMATSTQIIDSRLGFLHLDQVSSPIHFWGYQGGSVLELFLDSHFLSSLDWARYAFIVPIDTQDGDSRKSIYFKCTGLVSGRISIEVCMASE